MKAYAVIGGKRFAGLPDLPTFGELGYQKLNIDFWHMLLAPAKTPRPIVDKLNSALRVALDDPKVKKLFADGGMDLYPRDQETRTGYKYEPWHIRFVGVALSSELFSQGYLRGNPVCLMGLLRSKKLY